MARQSKRIVLKFGTGILTKLSGKGPDTAQFRRLSAEVAGLIKDGHECLIVSSGAVGAGMQVLGLEERPKDLPSIQACAAVGQSKLMQLYETMFGKHKLSVAQLLLTHADLDSRVRCANAKQTLSRLLTSHKVVPIINENDSVAVEELKFGDNDRLSVEVATMVEADLLILLTSVDGLMDENGERVPEVRDIKQAARLANPAEKGKLSVGGMVSKLDAVRRALDAGIPTVIASGRIPGRIPAVLAKQDVGTRFLTKSQKRA